MALVPDIRGYDSWSRIGRGGFAVVYRARQVTLDREVAVKVLLADLEDEDQVRRFENECRVLGRLGAHPNVVDVYEAGVTDEGRPFIVMKFYGLGSLADRLKARGPLGAGEVADIGIKVAGALQAAHSLGVIHRDIKPDNILLDDSGQPVLTDFGVAAVADASGGYTSSVAFSRAHVAPEVLARNEFGFASDIYSLGSTLFTLLTGRAAFAADTEALQYLAIMSEPVPDISTQGVPLALSRAIAKAMAKSPGDRYGNAELFAEDLVACSDAPGESVSTGRVLAETDDSPIVAEPVGHTDSGDGPIDAPTIRRPERQGQPPEDSMSRDSPGLEAMLKIGPSPQGFTAGSEVAATSLDEARRSSVGGDAHAGFTPGVPAEASTGQDDLNAVPAPLGESSGPASQESMTRVRVSRFRVGTFMVLVVLAALLVSLGTMVFSGLGARESPSAANVSPAADPSPTTSSLSVTGKSFSKADLESYVQGEIEEDWGFARDEITVSCDGGLREVLGSATTCEVTTSVGKSMWFTAFRNDTLSNSGVLLWEEEGPVPGALSIGWGSPADVSGCAASCTWIVGDVTGFAPNSTVEVVFWGSDGGWSPFMVHTVSTDGEGNGGWGDGVAYFGYPGQQVYVEVRGVRSNTITN